MSLSLHFNKVPILILHKSSNITTAILTQLDLPADKYPNQNPSHTFLIKKEKKRKNNKIKCYLGQAWISISQVKNLQWPSREIDHHL